MSQVNLTQKLLSGLLQEKGPSVPCNDAFTYEVIFLNYIVPDKTNCRYFPAIIINDEHANLLVNRRITKRQLVKIYDGEDHVLVGKSCFVNCLKYDSPEWRKVNKNIESITELANNILVSDLLQAPTIFPLEDEKYQILTGHRRFFALIYSKGVDAPTHFKVYKHQPLLQKVKQFQENASREDLPQFGKLSAFNAAKLEIETLSLANKQLGRAASTVREIVALMGISMGAYDNYNVLTRYPCVLKAYEDGLSFPFIKAKKIVKQVEQAYKTQHQKVILNINDKRAIDSEVKRLLTDVKDIKKTPEHFVFQKIKSSNTVKKLLSSNIMMLDVGIDWETVNWDNSVDVRHVMDKVIEFLEQEIN